MRVRALIYFMQIRWRGLDQKTGYVDGVGAEGVTLPGVSSAGFEHSIGPAVWPSARSSASPALRHRVLSQAELSRNCEILPRHTWDATLRRSGFN